MRLSSCISLDLSSTRFE